VRWKWAEDECKQGWALCPRALGGHDVKVEGERATLRAMDVLRSIVKWVGIVVGCMIGLFLLVAGWPASLGLVFFGLIVYGIIRLRGEHVMNRVLWTGSTRMEEDPPSPRLRRTGPPSLRLRRTGPPSREATAERGEQETGER